MRPFGKLASLKFVWTVRGELGEDGGVLSGASEGPEVVGG